MTERGRFIARWQRLIGLLTQAGRLGLDILEDQPAHLADDLQVAASLAAAADEETDPGLFQVRVVILDAARPGTSHLAQVLPVAIAPGTGKARVRLVNIPLAADDEPPSSAIQAELLDAHAVVLVVSYRDVVVAPQGRRTAEVAERVRDWLPLVMEIAAPDLLTIAVDGVEESNSNPESRLGWTRRQVWRVLSLPARWPQPGVCELSSRNALAAVADERAGRVPPGHLAQAWDDFGIRDVAERTFLPFDQDPARWMTESALRRTLAMFARAERELADLRAHEGIAPDRVLTPEHARRLQGMLISRGIASSLESAVPAVTSLLNEVRRS